jgi:hypothetical protein
MRIKTIIALCFFLLLTGCATLPPPDNAHNICSIFRQYPEWRQATEHTEQRWRVPVSVQMAIIYQESSFVSNAKPPRKRLLGFIPWKRPTSAYGYCQAIDHTWGLYQKSTCRYSNERHDFAEASEFVGWYADRAHRRAGISPSDAYSLYLAYHEGITNYMHKTYLKKAWLMKVAKKVRARSNMYQAQLYMCN